MRHELTADEIESYRSNGFVVIEDFLDAAELPVLVNSHTGRDHWAADRIDPLLDVAANPPHPPPGRLGAVEPMNLESP